MTVTDLLSTLIETTLSASAAILIVLSLRRLLRRAFDAGVAYMTWVLVPLAIVAVLLPAFPLPSAALRTMVGPGVSAIAALGLQAGDAALPYSMPILLVLWGMGVVMSALLLIHRQLHFERALGRLQAHDGGMYVAQQACAGLPAVIGIVRPRIVLPVDHAVRFDADQQMLVQEHEHVHIARGDQLTNLLAAIMRCLFWFNPLVYYAAPRFRHDQELACDVRVIALHPHARPIYGEALLRAQVSLAPAPLSCQIGFGHPLKERIVMLKQPLRSGPRRLTGTALVLLLVAGGGIAANAVRTPGTPPDRRAAFVVTVSPIYPAQAAAQGISGMVWLNVDYAADGSVKEVAVKRSEPAGVFDAVAAEAVKQWKIKPAITNGKPVPGRVVIPIRFAPQRQAISGQK